MNHNIKFLYIIILYSIGTLYTSSCHSHNHDDPNHIHGDDDGHNHSHDADLNQKSDSDIHNHDQEGKTVHLNLEQYKNAGIDTGWLEQKNLSEVITTTGYTKLPPQNQADVSPAIGGIVQSIKIIEGQYVKKGQILATIQSVAYNQLRMEKAKVLESLQGAKVNKEYLELEYNRQKILADENVNAKKTLQKTASDLALENEKIKNLSDQVKILQQTLALGGSASSPIISISAPISGYISDVHIKIGSNAEPGQPMFTILDNTQMHVDLLVYEKDLLKVKVDQKVRFILTNQDNQEIVGKIKNIGKSFENETKTVAVHADIITKNHYLIPGMYVNALIELGTLNVSALPIEAIVKAEGREFLFTVDNNKYKENQSKDEIPFKRIEVKTGVSQLGYIQVNILQPIDKQDKIVTKGAYYLQSHLIKESGGGGHAH